MKGLASVLAAWGVLLLASPVRAQPPPTDGDPQRTAAARALFEQGVRLVDEERWGEAEDRFRRALALRPSPQIRFNLAQTLGRQGELVEATEHLARIERDGQAADEVRRAAADLREQLAARLGTLRIAVRGERAGASVTLDGAPVPDEMLGVQTPVDPGVHRVALHRDGEPIDEAQVEVAPGGKAEAVLEASTAADSAQAQGALALGAEAEPGETDGGSGVLGEWWFWTAVGVVVLGGVATVLLLGTDADSSATEGDFEPTVVRF